MATYGCSPDYTRSYNDEEGTVESLCIYCRKTIASDREERKIFLLEEIHTCIAKLAANGALCIQPAILRPPENNHVHRPWVDSSRCYAETQPVSKGKGRQ